MSGSLETPPKKFRILTCNSHEAYVWSLSRVHMDLDIIDQLPGRYTKSWDTNMRPIPENARLISLQEALAAIESYDCFIGHNIDDLLLVKSEDLPKILLIHESLFGYLIQEKSVFSQEQVQMVLKTYMEQIRGTAVAISDMKMKSWGLEGRIIPHCIDSDFFDGYEGSLAQGLRVVNQFNAKDLILDREFHQALHAIKPIVLLGVNPDIPGSQPSQNLLDLRDHYRNHRYYVHTSRPGYEDGYNLASLEAMAVGMPIVCNIHPSSPVIHGINGYISDDPQKLKSHILDLLADRHLAQSLGQNARSYVKEYHSKEKFNQNWLEAIQAAIAQYR